MIRDVYLGSQIRILIFKYPGSQIQGSKKAPKLGFRILDPHHCNKMKPVLGISNRLVGKPLSVPQFCTGLEGAPPLGTAIVGVRRFRCFRGICATRQAVVANWPIVRPYKSKGAE
jgi:hypothetical protein